MEAKNNFSCLLFAAILIVCGCVTHSNGLDEAFCVAPRQMLIRATVLIVSMSILVLVVRSYFIYKEQLDESAVD